MGYLGCRGLESKLLCCVEDSDGIVSELAGLLRLGETQDSGPCTSDFLKSAH